MPEKENEKRNSVLRYHRVEEVLDLMRRQNYHSSEQMRLLREVMETDGKFRSLGENYIFLRSKISSLSKALSDMREQWEEQDRKCS